MKSIKALAILGALSCLLGSGCASGIEESIVFQPRAYPEGDWSTSGLFADAWFDAPDGTRLHGWFAEAKKPRAVVLFMHGNAGNVTASRTELSLFHDLGASVLAFDYRGYGRSEGRPSEAGVLSDARAARRWLAVRTGVRESDIILAGHSLGGGVAVDLAARDGALGLILDSTFTSLPDVAFDHMPFLPFRMLMRSRLESVAKIADYHGPLLQKHGDGDRVVPYESGKKLFAAANEPKEFISITGGGHNDPPTPEYRAALDRFLTAVSERK